MNRGSSFLPNRDFTETRLGRMVAGASFQPKSRRQASMWTRLPLASAIRFSMSMTGQFGSLGLQGGNYQWAHAPKGGVKRLRLLGIFLVHLRPNAENPHP